MYSKVAITIFSLVILCSYGSLSSYAADAPDPVKRNNKPSTSKPLIIQSQVKGTQEQPNVIYIMPWQGVEQVIEVKGKKRAIKLPSFKPIHPSAFKAQVAMFTNQQMLTKPETPQN